MPINNTYCPFCNPPAERILCRNTLWYARADDFPVSPGHTLLIPFRHFSNIFNCSDDEGASFFEVLQDCRSFLDDNYHPDGYNIIVNSGEAAGQSVFHAHVHMIPRYAGDVKNPRERLRLLIRDREAGSGTL
jgi:diadenosine tetraphosphate (Ap4A) HIT family hydrolase